MAKVSLPLERANELLDGGIEDGSQVLVLADLAVDKAKFAAALCGYRLEEDDNLVYFVNNRLPDYVKQYLDVDAYGDQLSFIDGFSATLGQESDEEFIIDADV